MTPSGCALVTGASRGIGAATARVLAEDGWAVGVNYREDAGRAQELVATIEAAGGEAVPIRADVSEPGAVQSAFAELEARYGRVAVLVNNAGVRADGIAPAITDDAWQSVVETNLSGAFWTSRRALPRMVRARFGRIVNVASVVGPCISNPGQANYAAAKAGLVGLTRTIAREVAHRGVTVNAVAPGFVETQLTADVDPALLASVPARRAAAPEDVAGCIRFLVSDAAGYVTGTTLTVDGGLTA